MLIAIMLITQIFAFETVKNIDIKRFMGTWYVISAIPTFAEKGCTNAYDIYTLNEDNTIKIEYYALKNDTPFSIIQKGQIIDNINNSKWKISFVDPWIPFYTAPYEVIILDAKNYKYMVVGSTNNYGWIMSRNQTMSDSIYNDILEELESQFKYDTSKFKIVQHNNHKNIN
tara:strand:+ start:47 stop:559 length:513 start_codon:yes stop_codon:yes gene_type:complete